MPSLSKTQMTKEIEADLVDHIREQLAAEQNIKYTEDNEDELVDVVGNDSEDITETEIRQIEPKHEHLEEENEELAVERAYWVHPYQEVENEYQEDEDEYHEEEEYQEEDDEYPDEEEVYLEEEYQEEEDADYQEGEEELEEKSEMETESEGSAVFSDEEDLFESRSTSRCEYQSRYRSRPPSVRNDYPLTAEVPVTSTPKPSQSSSSTSSSSGSQTSTTIRHVKRRRKYSAKKLKKKVARMRRADKFSDLQFLQSLVPYLRLVPPCKKLQSRLELINILMAHTRPVFNKNAKVTAQITIESSEESRCGQL